ncbi:MAG: serine protease [Bacteroidia bacterium]|nr:serine protease [Bacteroidia bacterium]
METFENLDPLLRTFWLLAIPTSLFFLIQTIMTFVGGHSSHDVDTGFDMHFDGGDAHFQPFSLRNLIQFLLGFSWTGIAFYDTISSPPLLIGLGVVVGSLFVYMFFVLLRQIQKLAEDNSFKLSDTLNKTAEVYLTIPEKKSGTGKILVSVNGSVHELEAMTEKDKIPSGTVVKIVKLENESIFVETL